MRFDVYCDESRPDLLGSQTPPAAYTMIGSLWLPSEFRDEFKQQIHNLRDRHRIGGEFKWVKASPSKLDFYFDLIRWFFSTGTALRFRCIAIDHSKVDLMKFHGNSQELGFYKFYYQLLHHWILDNNRYSIFCDYKKNRDRDRLEILKDCLQAANMSSEVLSVQATRSRESVLIQLADVLTGAVGAKLNAISTPNSAKSELIKLIESCLSKEISHTRKSEEKFNVFVIDLGGGW